MPITLISLTHQVVIDDNLDLAEEGRPTSTFLLLRICSCRFILFQLFFVQWASFIIGYLQLLAFSFRFYVFVYCSKDKCCTICPFLRLKTKMVCLYLYTIFEPPRCHPHICASVAFCIILVFFYSCGIIRGQACWGNKIGLDIRQTDNEICLFGGVQ